LGAFATRLAGSSDLYEPGGRRPYHSINFITSHDGFPLNDLVSYNGKHNEVNGEDNRDGDNNNLSYNYGVEGATRHKGIERIRVRQIKNMLSTMMLSQGVPMMLSGDECRRTQHGNNNAYCQDNEITWIDWNLAESQESLVEFTRSLARLRHEHPVFRRRRFFHGRKLQGRDVPEVAWLDPTGEEMTEEAWNESFVRCLGVLLTGGKIDVDEEGEEIIGDTFLLLFNADHGEPITFRLPATASGGVWNLVFDTGRPDLDPHPCTAPDYEMEACSVVVFTEPVAE
ncbi:MAG: glycogen debranching enzyme GlgX, partial [Planctomycetales bacterium]|nr:glycogen debranching enzyme GlgX [Planctomycetales bacterium]